MGKEFQISEHAIIRYLERVLGLDLEIVMAEMLPEHVKAQIATLENGDFPVKTRQGFPFWLRVRNKRVITVLTLDPKVERKRRHDEWAKKHPIKA